MRKFLFIIAILPVLFIITGCGGKNSGDTAKGGGGDSAENNACPEKSAVTVQSKNGGYPAEPIDWTNIKATAAKWGFSGLGGDSRSITVYLANTELTPENLANYYGTELAAGQGIIALSFTNGQKNSEAGIYKPNPQFAAPMRISAGIYVKGKVTVQFDDFKTEGTAEITEMTSGRVCGKFKLKDPWSSVEGIFSAPVIK